MSARLNILTAVTIALILAASALAAGPTPVRSRGADSNYGLAGQQLFVDYDSNAYWTSQNWLDAHRYHDATLMQKIADNPSAIWFGDWSNGHGSTQADVQAEVTRETDYGAYPVLVAYNIPWRDCGSYSSGGASSPAAYAAWIGQVAAGIGDNPAAVILEPDALAELDCLSKTRQVVYEQMIADAVRQLSRNPKISVYIDAGNGGWNAPKTIAARLRAADIADAAGFALNVSYFDWTSSELRYGTAISKLTGGKHFVIDTSRNGRGPAPHAAWCNPPGRGLGSKPTTRTGHPLVDAFLWIKAPGESDGACRGGPRAGEWWPSYALGLARRAAF